MLVLFWLKEPVSTDTCATEPAGSYVKTTTKFKDGLDVRRPTLPQLVVFSARVPVCLIPSVTSVFQGVRRVQPYFHTCVGIATTRRCSRSFGPLGDGFAPSCERCGVMFFSIGTVMFTSIGTPSLLFSLQFWLFAALECVLFVFMEPSIAPVHHSNLKWKQIKLNNWNSKWNISCAMYVVALKTC